jgi:hypothetical protein
VRRALPAAIFLAAAAAIFASGRLAGDWRIDEAHKISETANLSPSAWKHSRVERANPPVGKWVFALAAPPVPYDPAFTERAARGERVPPPHLAEAYARALPRVRLVSLMATALTAALVYVLSESLLASLLYFFSFLTQAFSATAVFDPLLTLLMVAAAVPLAREVTWPRTVAAAVLAALAVDVRLSGALALAGVLALLLVRRKFVQAAAATGISIALAIAMNPLYFFTQFHDLQVLLAATGQHRLSAGEKLRFVSEYAFGDFVGIAILVGLCFAPFGVRPSRPHSGPPASSPAGLAASSPPVFDESGRRDGAQPAGGTPAVLAWCATVVVLFTAWLPVGYPRYVLVIIPALAIAAAHGYRHGVVAAGQLAPGRRRSANTGPARATTSYDGNGRNERT